VAAHRRSSSWRGHRHRQGRDPGGADRSRRAGRPGAPLRRHARPRQGDGRLSRAAAGRGAEGMGALRVQLRVLLDTHALLWWLDGDRRLPVRVRRLMTNRANVVFVSAASAWEITTKARLGKLPGALAVAADVAA